ncbi:Benzoyl-CoA reductase/2-hydroxyglutaryl-CoA dehydratase subunit, BcrC/BadD/HgdB [Thermosyntropha lipolytica DSM 11003]|uniref:Benzoyl-CoA reductase/2-hydroxyglutaryl-CoA dehydratase subunit, BcrC/BadD/HgdB n=1 Tax=Thermosyntropha lipolytica DSM 11003 TaxID=1123382 RepID=A0A1M5RRP1_9FIRM|nr:double-cubane-cluster-containing anaerobic reductase [Thermosyntropha lipolytica]SHH28945.1 Benzoyl-CoA reductase/2-hydroxyglutaryl-CoA dehydratase subunit, BcrC/BadD/HgdB [Thermosyntropha lipolytica DSM 11003]
MPDIDIKDFSSIREVNLMRIKEGKEKGLKVVGIYCTYCPQELILAAGAIPVGLCGTKEDPIAAAEEVLPRNLCPLIKSSYGFAATDTCPFFHFSDVIIGETTCDGKKKMFEIMNEIKPVHVMQLPYLKDSPAGFALWVEELRRLRAFLEETFAVKIKDEDIWAAIDRINAETIAAKEICDLNQMDIPPLSGIELLTVTWSRSFTTDKEEVTEMMSQLKERILQDEERKKKGKPRARILLTGCPVGLGTEKVIRITEELGAAVVAMENCTGYKTLELLADKEYDDPIVALAHKYIKIPCSCMSPNSYRLDLISRMIDDFRVDAVIDLTWQACHTYNIEAYEIEKLVKGKGLPYLHLESDYSSSDLETIKIRVEALLEMIGK